MKNINTHFVMNNYNKMNILNKKTHFFTFSAKLTFLRHRFFILFGLSSIGFGGGAVGK